MKIHEYQAKQILAEYGIPTSKGSVARTLSEVEEIANNNSSKKILLIGFGGGLSWGISLINS